MTSKLKEAPNRIAASRPAKRNGNREVIRSKVDSGACCAVINHTIADDYPLKETEASRKDWGKAQAPMAQARGKNNKKHTD